MADISYTRTTWADGQEGGTAIDATKLNNIEQGVVDAVAAIGPNDTTEDGTLKAQIDQNASDISDLQDSVCQLTNKNETAFSFNGVWSNINRMGNIVVVTLELDTKTAYAAWNDVLICTVDPKPVGYSFGILHSQTDGLTYCVQCDSSGTLYLRNLGVPLSASNRLRGFIVYAC